jgi:GNAT superfamily N-acetyltransferase
VAVRREARGLGVGRAVTRALERRALVRGLAEIRLHAQLAVEHFYVGLGYRSIGGPHPTAGIEHVWMTRSLIPGLRRVRDADGPALERLIGGIWAEYPGCVLDVDREEPWLRAPASAYGDRSGPPSAGSGDDHGHRAYRGAMWVVEAPGPARADGPAGELIGCVAIREIAAAAGGAGVLGAGLAVAGCAAAGASPSETVGLAPAPRPRMELKSLYVAAPARHAGLGAALAHRVEREARRRGAASVELWTDTRFTDAHRLYERLGYVATGGLRELRDLSGTVELGYALDPLPAP